MQAQYIDISARKLGFDALVNFPTRGNPYFRQLFN